MHVAAESHFVVFTTASFAAQRIGLGVHINHSELRKGPEVNPSVNVQSMQSKSTGQPHACVPPPLAILVKSKRCLPLEEFPKYHAINRGNMLSPKKRPERTENWSVLEKAVYAKSLRRLRTKESGKEDCEGE
jgi:hypothetical protein